MELPAPAAGHPAWPRRQGCDLDEESTVQPRVPHPAAAAAAIEHPGPRPAVLLIDEVDRADEEFEAFLFELLAECQRHHPRDRHPARDAPAGGDPDVEPHARSARRPQAPLPVPLDRLPRSRARDAIVRLRVPEADRRLVAEVAAAVQRLRGLDVQKPPGVAEAIDWVHAATLLGIRMARADAVDAPSGRF